MTSAPSCFIGSSTEGLPYAVALASHLHEKGVICEMWNLTTFALGQTTMEALEQALDRHSFAALVATADDRLISRKSAKLGPRDNVIFEFGLFAGRLGRARAFLVVERGAKSIKLPSDLLGVTVASFTSRTTKQARRNAMEDAAAKIHAAVEREGPVEAPADPALANELLSAVAKRLQALRATKAVTMNERQRRAWTASVLAAAVEPFLARRDDAYAVWMAPADTGDEVLRVVDSVNLGDQGVHEWKRGEGLAGRVWETGQSQAVDSLKTHSWYEAREGCENESYLCVAIGSPCGEEGVLAVGSDSGFDIRHGDMAVLEAYGELLAVSMPRSGSKKGAATAANGGSGTMPAAKGGSRRSRSRRSAKA